MKILLIYPPREAAVHDPLLWNFKGIDVGTYPPLGIMYVAAHIEYYTSHKVSILDVPAEKLSLQDVANKIRETKPDIVGVYADSCCLFGSYSIVKIAKEINRDIKTIMGGPHLDIYPKETISLYGVDFIVIGEGEFTIVELLDCIAKSGDFHKIRGIAFKEGDKIVFTERRPILNNLDEVLFPARHLVNKNNYYSIAGRHDIITTMMSSRGCAFRCTFCNIIYDGKYRMRSASNVVEEIEDCLRQGIKEFFFFDETFTLNRERIIKMCDMIIDRKLKITFDIRTRVDKVDEELLKKLEKAGCERIQFGIESGTERILKCMNKGTILKQSYAAVKAAKKAKLLVYGDFLFAYPDETKEEIMTTINFALKLDLDFAQFSTCYLLPRTKIYEDAIRDGFINDYWREFAISPQPQVMMPYGSRIFSEKELSDMARFAYSKFYLRPKQILKRLNQISSLRQLIRQAKAGYKLFLGQVQKI